MLDGSLFRRVLNYLGSSAKIAPLCLLPAIQSLCECARGHTCGFERAQSAVFRSPKFDLYASPGTACIPVRRVFRGERDGARTSPFPVSAAFEGSLRFLVVV